jgi:CspA family cold shock protein
MGLASLPLWRYSAPLIRPPAAIHDIRCPGFLSGLNFEKIEEVESMAQGTIKKLTDKGFGFISTGSGDLFLHEGQTVEYTEGQGPKGPRAENVRPA